MSRKHPYKRFENDRLWRLVDRGIKVLAKNGDLEEKTARTYIVGYLTQMLHEAGVTADDDAAKSRRIIRIKKHEEVVVRTGVA